MILKVIGVFLLSAFAVAVIFSRSGNTKATLIPDKKPVGNVLGTTLSSFNKEVDNLMPQKIMEDVVNRITTQVSSDASSLATSIANSFFAAQVVNSYNAANQQTKEQIKGQICK